MKIREYATELRASFYERERLGIQIEYLQEKRDKLKLPMAKWLCLAYFKLYKEVISINYNGFNHSVFEKLFKKSANVVASELCKAGMIRIEFNKKDRRKRIYHLKQPSNRGLK